MTPAFAKPAEGRSRIFEPKDLFALEQAQDPQIRPDGSAVAYVRASEDIMIDNDRRAIWLADVNTGAQTSLVTGQGSAFTPRWSPDGQRLAYVSTAEGRPQLYVRCVATGPRRPGSPTCRPRPATWHGRRTGAPSPSPCRPRTTAPVSARRCPKPEGAKWAEPLTVIDAVTYRFDGAGYLRPGFSHIYTVSAEGGAPRQLTFGAFNERSELNWTPDGRAILFSAKGRLRGRLRQSQGIDLLRRRFRRSDQLQLPQQGL